MIRRTLVVRLGVVCVALVMAGATLPAAEQPPSLVGATREQVLARLGEPRSQIVAGNRVVLFFARDRVVLRDGIVVEVERLPESAPRTPPPPAAPADPAAATGEPGAPPPAPPGSAATTGAAATVPPETPAAPAEPKFEIKGVRRPGRPPLVPPKQEEPPAATSATEPAATRPPAGTAPMPTTAMPATATPPSVATTTGTPTATATVPTPSARTDTVATVSPTAPVPPESEPEDPKPEETEAENQKDKKAKANIKKARRDGPSEPDIPDTAEIITSKQNFVITFLVVASGVGYLVWRVRQRQLALAATAVSHPPFSVPAAAKTGGVVFDGELLQKLEWKRFEELVAAYYSKTGVVAVRTKSGPHAAVHIKISWKGEPRPFAYVQCIAQPAGLIGPQPLQELVSVLQAEDIRRGYVVTSGKFGVSARDLAEEKHITLLPGDIFLEKLNALPESARAELMQQTTAGDYTTPSCPKCEAKMVKSPDNPSLWRCAAHPDQQLPSRGAT